MTDNVKIICIDARYIFPNMDGIGRYLYNLIDEISLLTEKRKDIKFLILEIDKFADTSILRALDNRQNLQFVRIRVFPQTVRNHFLQNYLKKYQIDLFHYPQFDFPFFINYPSVVTLYDMNPQTHTNFFHGKKGIIKKYYSILTNYVAIIKANSVIAISKTTKSEIINFYGNKYGEKIEVVYLGVDKKFYGLTAKSTHFNLFQKIKNKYNFEKYLLYVGNDRPHKNIKNLLLSFKNFKIHNNSNIKLILAGKFSYDKSFVLSEELEKLFLTEDVIQFTPSDDELIVLYLFAEAFLFLSLSEGFGLPILEAMALGVPVITSNTSSLKEIGEGAAFLVNPLNFEEISAAMEKVVILNNERENLVTLGRLRANKFTWQLCAEQTLTIYDKILNSVRH